MLLYPGFFYRRNPPSRLKSLRKTTAHHTGPINQTSHVVGIVGEHRADRKQPSEPDAPCLGMGEASPLDDIARVGHDADLHSSVGKKRSERRERCSVHGD